MHDAQESIDSALAETVRARKAVRAGKSRQVASSDEKDYLKSVVYSWSNRHRPVIATAADTTELQDLDTKYDRILTATAKNAARSTYVLALGDINAALIKLRSSVLLPSSPRSLVATGDAAPDFAPLAADRQMQEILSRRWQECQRCKGAGAHLAATVMMGGLLEALFVARSNRMLDKSPLFRAKTTPVDSQTKKPLQLKDWTLRPYIDVGHELGWITKSGKDVAAVLRDYRNYVHPEKERAHGITLGEFDSAMFWEITKLLARQLLTT